MAKRNTLALSAALAAFMSVATVATAQTDPTSTSPAPAPAKAQKKVADPRVDDQAIVCKREDATGTRLGATKVCHTRSEWAAEAMSAREHADHMQVGGKVL